MINNNINNKVKNNKDFKCCICHNDQLNEMDNYTFH